MKRFVLILLIGLAACNPYKRVQKNQQLFDRIGNEWALKNPCTPDSFVTVKPGRIDSVPFPVFLEKKVVDTPALIAALRRNDSTCTVGLTASYAYGYNDAIDSMQKIKVPKQQPDTIEIKKPDTRKEKALMAQLQECKEQRSAFEAVAEKLNKQFKMALIIGGVLLALLIAAIIFLIRK